ncbi:I78 family peptidase inhibitor [Pseudomonas sp. ZM23]|uniref:I78 family peptidase inhibitor n=1 Tax=Pseudomonas triclosanedens TaxID=2961893 RepID=A0ABY7A4K2_9PSED|nr:I78 family peptidase inhibitor [Pseudomonas triclosanedens]MCP8465791.1 I78 family peptidase inhibitor [Pseudomonas triclosanedens]MCP8471286.1 I78 family peptidase inhibitor [Pseudomonas triclosanedens]MCP8477090.1 I78 family peptidase inhibitor [Pseudomonas triclosanedens]WAI51802.1 I78 family peptidase inhibitor [Pseudomonas triclosanedens]
MPSNPMSWNRTLLSIFAVAALAGCSSKDSSSDTAPQAAQTPPALSGACNAKAVQSLIGKAITPTLAEEARRDAGASVSRVLRPHEPVTMEYNSQRLNIDVDDRGVVHQVSCG